METTLEQATQVGYLYNFCLLQRNFMFQAAIRRARDCSQGKFTFCRISGYPSLTLRVRDASVGQIKFIPGLRKLSSIGRSVQPALIAYYSEADAMRAAENLEGNDSLSRSEPLGVEYMGTDEEAKISEDEFMLPSRFIILIPFLRSQLSPSSREAKELMSTQSC